MEHKATGRNHIQVGGLSSGTRRATLPMPNTGPKCTPHQSAMPLYGLPGTTLCTTMLGNHYPNYTTADHESSAGTPRTSDAPYFTTCPWKSYPLVALKYSTKHTNVSKSPLHHEAVALQWAQQGGWWEFFALPNFLSFAGIVKPSNSSHRVLQSPPPVSPTKTSLFIVKARKCVENTRAV